MSKPVIETKKVSKKYLLYHENQGRYDTLVETLAHKACSFIKKGLGRHSEASEKKYEEFWALKDINVSINAGDRVGIIGRNGAGKSTFLKLLSRITEPTSGSIKIRGRVACLLEVGTGFHPELTGRENIFLNGAILGMKRKEVQKNFDEIVAFSEVEQFLDTPMKRYSSGMHTRLGFAVAAHLDPELLIVDEVLAVGDAQFQDKCLKKLNQLGDEGRTILFVSHDIGSVLTLCNKGIFLEKGVVKAEGLIDHCVNEYMRNCQFHTVRWEGNEGDDHARFYSASLQSNQPGKEFFYQHEQVELELQYEVLKPSQDIVLGVSVWNQRNQMLARSQIIDDVDNFHVYNRLGKHRVSFKFDAALFHEGEYYVKVDCGLHNQKRILTDEILLRFPIYATKKHTRFTHSASKAGISLGKGWKQYSE